MKKNDSEIYEAPFADADPAGVCDKDTADGNASGTISFENLFDLEEIQHIQDLFAKATGVACQILRPDGTFITERSNYCRLCGDIIRENEKGLAKCNESDTSLGQLNPEGLNIYRCGSAGLLEAGAPICVAGKHIATWGLGQVCDGTQTEAGIRAYAREIGADEDAATDAFKHVTVMTRERFEEVARMMHAVANQLAATGYQNLRQARLIEEHERTKEKLAQFEWLLEKDGDMAGDHCDEYLPPYPDVTALNTRRVILDAVGKDLLTSMARDLMDLLDTSVTVYEANGDYAYRVFPSSWCRVFDAASFRLCGTDDTQAALHSGKWLCHECCWRESARTAIESGEPTDMECVGGIRLYAVPIRVNGETVGVINIGYGTPPRDDVRLQELAEHFGLDIHDVRRASAAYRPRPQYIIDAAKRRCRSVAHHIGEIVQRRRAQAVLEEQERQLSTLMGNLPGIAYRYPNKPGWPVAFLSAGCQAITGYSPEELGGGGPPMYEDLIYPDDRQLVHDAVEKSIRNGESFVLEYRIRNRQGAERWVWEQGRAVGKDADGVAILEGFISDITELKSMQFQLEKQKEMLELVINSAPINIFWKDMDSVYTGCNTKFLKSAGKQDIDDILGKSDLDLIWSSEAQKHLDDDNEVLTTGNPKLEYEENYILPDGSKVWWRTSKIPLKDGNGEVMGLLAISEDITERKKAEDALQRQRDRLDYVIEASRLGTWAWNIKENTAEFNEMWATLLGHTMNEIGPSSYELWKSLGHPEDVPKIEALLQQCASGEMLDYSSEFRMRHKDGHWVWILDRGRVMTYDTEDRPLEMFGTHADITPLIQAEEELRQSEAKFRSYVEQAPHGVFIADESGHYVDTNPAASQLTGYTQDELLKMGIRHMVPPDGREAGAAHFAQVVEQGFVDGVLPHVRKDGTRRLWNVTAVRLNKNRILGFVQDVTEREQMEKQVRAAQKLDAIGQLAGGVAHDFNNLLMGIMGYTELCLDEIEEENPIRQWLDEIMHEAKRSADIVRQLLAFSRKQTIAPRILNLNDAVENMLKMLRRLIGEDIDLLWQPGRNLTVIRIDPGQVDQILANLCVNARDAIGGVGKITIETANTTLDEDYCATHAEAQPGDFVMLAVSDSGSGMDAETQTSVFEPFFTTKAEGEGTGLGLATVYGIVKQNDGSINVYSEPGEGTTFRIYLPCCESSENDAGAKKVSSTTPGGNETLLVVEDQQAICRIIRRFLKPLGYTVYTAESPVRALEIMDESGGEIDVLITDVVMPGMNGRELAEKLQAMKPELKVLYMSGYTANVIAHRGILEEGVNFISKPITRGQLARKLRNMLD